MISFKFKVPRISTAFSITESDFSIGRKNRFLLNVITKANERELQNEKEGGRERETHTHTETHINTEYSEAESKKKKETRQGNGTHIEPSE